MMFHGWAIMPSASSELGVRADKSLSISNGVLTLRSQFAWAHDFNPDRAISAIFQRCRARPLS